MSISVIVPVYNTKPYLRKCIDSILAQTYKDIEIILVDDGSCDGSETVCDEYAEKYPTRVKAVHQQNGGSSRARNTGIESATGDYLAFVDSDDYIDSNMYEEMIKRFYDEDISVVSSGMIRHDSEGVHYTVMPNEEKILKSAEEVYSEFLKNWNGFLDNSSCNKIFRTNIVKAVKYKKGICSEDIEFSLRLYKECKGVVCMNQAFYHYDQRPNSITTSILSDWKIKMLDIVSEGAREIAKDFPNLKIETQYFELEWLVNWWRIIHDRDEKNQFKKQRNSIKNKICNILKVSDKKRALKEKKALMIYSYAIKYRIYGVVHLLITFVLHVRKGESEY